MPRTLRFPKNAARDRSGYGVTEYVTVLTVVCVLLVVVIAWSKTGLAEQIAASCGIIPQTKPQPSMETAAAGQIR